jgi:ABC-type sugar transport system ATPase subunit
VEGTTEGSYSKMVTSSARKCIMDEPTQGIVVNSKVEIYNIGRELAESSVYNFYLLLVSESG